MSEPSASGSDPAGVGMWESSPSEQEVSAIIDSLKKQVASDRADYVKKRMEENAVKVQEATANLHKLAMERGNSVDGGVNLLSKRQKDAMDIRNGVRNNNGDIDNSSSWQDGYAPSAILLGSKIDVKCAVRPIKLPAVEKLPSYKTSVFLDRNQRMTEDQSVVSRRRIYYDRKGSEAIICGASEEEAIEGAEEKKKFNESEDFILRKTIEEVGLSETTFDSLAQCVSRKPSEIKARYEDLVNNFNDKCHVSDENAEDSDNPYIDKDLDSALDSFDSLFCRRCLTFDCRLHGRSQGMVLPAKKQVPWSGPPDAEQKPCSRNCQLLVVEPEVMLKEKAFRASDSASNRKESKSPSVESGSSTDDKTINEIIASSKAASGVLSDSDKRSSNRIAENPLLAKKKPKKMTSDSDPVADCGLGFEEFNLRPDMESTSSKESRKKESPLLDLFKSLMVNTATGRSNENENNQPMASSSDNLNKEATLDENTFKAEETDDHSWKPFEISMYEKGLEMFGRNSCLIWRNLLSGMKTCLEIYNYMQRPEKKSPSSDDSPEPDGNETAGTGAHKTSTFSRRKIKPRRLKYSWKSAVSRSFRKRISERKDQPCMQYNTCGCQSACGKSCPCLVNGTFCEKYCGCPKSCKNRFRGCHCTKGQCRSRQCLCFAADRECDPDVCRNCWISCGDGTLGAPPPRGDNYECQNMKLLLKQHQQVLLGRSDVSGWGAFSKNSVNKHEYIGEYTGELISHREADKRGKIYDRENSSFLFNLNDQFVVDAKRKGNKLKFVNHSPEPNCYAKLIMSAGDHRIGIFAKEPISAGEELFLDYHYEPDQAPDWAQQPESSGVKRDEGGPSSSGHAKKHT